MTNPYAAFANYSDDEDEKPTIVKAQDKVHRTHADKRAFKKQQEDNEKRAKQIARNAPASQALPEKIKESHKYGHIAKEKKAEIEKKQWKEKDSNSHYHDKRSGTGREDRPRKAGGGYGNVGNAKDMQQTEKYVKEGEEPIIETTGEAVEVEQKEPEVEKLTLEEYYRAKGVDLSYNPERKEPIKKEEIKAEWIKKEKLTLISTKEDKKNQEKKAQQVVKHSDERDTVDEGDFNKLGFGSKPAPKDVKRDEERRDNKGGKGRRGNQPQFSNEDFPTL